MKLIVEVEEDSTGTGHIIAYLKADDVDGKIRDSRVQAENARRLGELTTEIEKTVKAYYSKGKASKGSES